MKINEFFAEHNKIALAFSGGADSSYLLYAAVKCGADVAPYFVKSQFQPEFEREDAYHLARELGVRLHEIDVDVLQFHDVTVNPSNRCYFCKRHIWARYARPPRLTDMTPLWTVQTPVTRAGIVRA